MVEELQIKSFDKNTIKNRNYEPGTSGVVFSLENGGKNGCRSFGYYDLETGEELEMTVVEEKVQRETIKIYEKESELIRWFKKGVTLLQEGHNLQLSFLEEGKMYKVVRSRVESNGTVIELGDSEGSTPEAALQGISLATRFGVAGLADSEERK